MTIWYIRYVNSGRINLLIQSEVNICLNIPTFCLPSHQVTDRQRQRFFFSVDSCFYVDLWLVFWKKKLDGHTRDNLVGISALGRILDWVSNSIILCFVQVWALKVFQKYVEIKSRVKLRMSGCLRNSVSMQFQFKPKCCKEN